MTDLDQDLKQSLATQASRVPQGSDLGRGAIVRGRGIRRRRRVVGGVAFAALVAIAVPVGLEVGDSVSRNDGQVAPATTGPTTPTEITGPRQVNLDLTALPLADEPPQIPYVEGQTVVVGDERYNVDATGDLKAVAAFDGGAHLFVSRGSTAELVRVTPEGSEVLGAAAGTPIASADLRWNAYAIGDVDKFGNVLRGITLTLFDSQDGSTSEINLPAANYVDIYALVDGTVYLRPHSSDGTELPLQTWAPGQEAPSYLPTNYYASAVSDDGRVIADMTKVTDFGSCTEVRGSGRSSLWQTCAQSILGFSPGAVFAWAGPAYLDGYSLGDIVIIDAQTGDVIRRLPSFDNGLDFMDATFEDADHLLIRVEQGGQTALVRCAASTGQCELAVPVADGTSELGSPYLLSNL